VLFVRRRGDTGSEPKCSRGSASSPERCIDLHRNIGVIETRESFRRSREVREGILTSPRSPAALTKRIGHDIFGEDPREPYQIGATSRVKILAVTGPMCLNSCSRAESSEAVLACAISFVMLP
jgi:hypothetical protein